MTRVWNFSAGPATLPEEVLKQAADEMLEYKDTGMSVMEMSHRSAAFTDIIETAQADLRELMNIPDNYKVLFLQGGDSLIFATSFMNLATNGKADYIVSGSWSKKAFQEAQILGDAKLLASSEDDNYAKLPDLSNLGVRQDTSYVYICQNETIYGVKYPELPDTQGKELVADQSSMFLSEPVDVKQYGMIHAGVQKNVGPAGVQIIIIKDNLLTDDLPNVPKILRYKTQTDKDSLYNTPPCYGIYICGLVFKWIKEHGGLEGMKKRNEQKAQLLYDYLDNSKLFKGTADKTCRSLVNVPFITGSADLDAKFVKEAGAAGIANIKGHRSVGGMRASMYNAMPFEGTQALVEFMKKFEQENA